MVNAEDSFLKVVDLLLLSLTNDTPNTIILRTAIPTTNLSQQHVTHIPTVIDKLYQDRQLNVKSWQHSIYLWSHTYCSAIY
jgi:hypothetical protein